MVRWSRSAEEVPMQQEANSVSSSRVHNKITDEIVAAIAAGALKFEMPWHRSGPTLGRPINVVSKNLYRGVNVLALWVAAQKKGYSSGLWGTYRQWKQLHAQVRKREAGTVIVFFKEIERVSRSADDEDAPEK